MVDRLRFLLNRIRERLWVRPLALGVLSIAGAFVAKMADLTTIDQYVPNITPDSLETLLKIISASMLVIATFAVASMVSAYASASSTATPRSFALVVADDVSQNALSTFIGAFIFSIVGLVALQNSYYEVAARFVLFVVTLVVFAMVILTFVRWVDSIARLGRLGATVKKVEDAAATALRQRQRAPTLGGIPARPRQKHDLEIQTADIGYVQRIDIDELQAYAEEAGVRITVAALPGTFSAPGRSLAYVSADSGEPSGIDTACIAKAFRIGDDRVFDEDPRFGLVVLSEIASRALSPAVNDPGTAIDIIGSLVRLFALWSEADADADASDTRAEKHDRVAVPEIALKDMFDDAFSAIARDGAGTIEVVVRLQKALASLATLDDPEMQAAAKHHARLALARAEKAMSLPEDLEAARAVSVFAR